MGRVYDIVKSHPEVESVLYTVGGETTGVNEANWSSSSYPLRQDLIAKDFVNAIRPEFASIPRPRSLSARSSPGRGLGKEYHGRGIGS